MPNRPSPEERHAVQARRAVNVAYGRVADLPPGARIPRYTFDGRHQLDQEGDIKRYLGNLWDRCRSVKHFVEESYKRRCDIESDGARFQDGRDNILCTALAACTPSQHLVLHQLSGKVKQESVAMIWERLAAFGRPDEGDVSRTATALASFKRALQIHIGFETDLTPEVRQERQVIAATGFIEPECVTPFTLVDMRGFVNNQRAQIGPILLFMERLNPDARRGVFREVERGIAQRPERWKDALIYFFQDAEGKITRWEEWETEFCDPDEGATFDPVSPETWTLFQNCMELSEHLKHVLRNFTVHGHRLSYYLPGCLTDKDEVPDLTATQSTISDDELHSLGVVPAHSATRSHLRRTLLGQALTGRGKKIYGQSHPDRSAPMMEDE